MPSRSYPRAYRVPDLDRPGSEVNLELDLHLELTAQELMDEGMDPVEARREAERRFGDRAAWQRKCTRYERRWRRSEWGSEMMVALWQDLRYAFRRLLQSPGFTLVALFSLALGIGANTAIFSIANAIVFRDLPIVDRDQVVHIFRKMPGFPTGPHAYPDFVDIKNATEDVFTDMAAMGYTFGQVDEGDRIDALMGEMVSGTYFTLMGLDAHIGRTFTAEDDVSPGGHYVVMLGYDHWMNAYGGDVDVLGRTIRMNGHSYEIIGVAPESYPGYIRGFSPAFYVPVAMINQLQSSTTDQLQARGNQSYFIRARLRPGVSVEQARVTMVGMTADFRERFPTGWDEQSEIVVTPDREVIINPMIDTIVLPATVLAMVVVGMVLLIACANLASFLLARATDRRKEVAIRLALGAKRGTLIRQLLTESIVLSLMGGVAGVALALWSVRIGMSVDLPFPIPIDLETGLDGRVLGFSLAISVLAGLVFGMAPAIQSTNPDVAPTLKDESTGGGRPRRLSLRNTLVVGQVAVSLMLLIGAGLFLRSLGEARSMDPGFGHEPTALITFGISGERFTQEEGRVFIRDFEERALAIPGIQAVGLTGNLHLNSLSFSSIDINVDGFDPPQGRQGHLIDRTEVDPGFFDAAGIPIVRGRSFDDSDVADGQQVAIINEAMAQRFWPGEDAVGRIVRSVGGTDILIVGVAQSTKVRTLGEPPRSFLYRPFSQNYSSFVTFLARTAGSAEQAGVQILSLLREMDPGVVIVESKTMEEHLATMLIPARLSAFLSTLFGALAMALAVIGLYGVVSYAVAQRSREMGIRMSLGAAPKSVVSLMVRGGMTLVAVGGVIGLVLAFLATRAVQGFLFGIAPMDPVAFLSVPAVLGGVALLAAYIPARRASRVDPVRSLKAE
jgi:predicted permease